MLGFLRSTSAPIAIDFGYSAVKVLQIQPGETHELIGAAAAEIPHHIRQNQAERNRYLVETLPQLVQRGRFKGKVAVCSIPAWQTFVQHLQVDKSEQGNLAEQVRMQLQANIGCDPDRAVIRHVEVGDVVRHGQSMKEMICFAVSRDVVMGQVDLLRKCKLEVAGLHAEPIALLQAFRHLYRRAGDESTTTIYVDLGYHGTKVMIAHGIELRFTKSIPVGGRHFDQEIANSLHCEIDAAHAHRMTEISAGLECGQPIAAHRTSAAPRFGAGSGEGGDVKSAMQAGSQALLGPGESTAATEATTFERRQGSVPREFQPIVGQSAGDHDDKHDGHEPHSGKSLVRQAVDEVVLQLVDELRMCVRYHRAMFPDRPINRMILNGGEGRDVELCRQIASYLGFTAFVGDPLKRIRRDDSVRLIGLDDLHNQPGWAVPMGLCLCPMGE